MRVADFAKRETFSSLIDEKWRGRNSRVSVEVSAVDCLDQLLRHFDDLLSPQPDAVVLDVDVVVVRCVGRFLNLLVG